MGRDLRPPTRSGGLNDMRWCTCGHGQPAHTRGVGRCHGGTSVGAGPCQCQEFDERPRGDQR